MKCCIVLNSTTFSCNEQLHCTQKYYIFMHYTQQRYMNVLHCDQWRYLLLQRSVAWYCSLSFLWGLWYLSLCNCKQQSSGRHRPHLDRHALGRVNQSDIGSSHEDHQYCRSSWNTDRDTNRWMGGGVIKQTKMASNLYTKDKRYDDGNPEWPVTEVN